MVPIAGSPGPRIAGRGLLRNDYDAPATYALCTLVDSEARHFARRGRHRRDGAGGIVHAEVIAVEPFMPSGFLAFERGVHVRCGGVAGSPNDGGCEKQFETAAKISS